MGAPPFSNGSVMSTRPTEELPPARAASRDERAEPNTLRSPDCRAHAPDDSSGPSTDSAESRSTSSSARSSSSLSTGENVLQARNRRFPPLLPSTNRPGRFDTARFSARLARLAVRVGTSSLTNDYSTSATNESSSEDSREEESHGACEESAAGSSRDDGNVTAEHDAHYSRIQALWEKLRDQRNVVQQLRVQLSSNRRQLKELRSRKAEADNRFMHSLRPALVTGDLLKSGELVLRQFEEIQLVSNDYRDAEAKAEQLEDELEEEEFRREIIETQFFTTLLGSSPGTNQGELSLPDSEDDSCAPPSRASLLGITAERAVDIHPLYKQLLDAVGDRELAKEHHTELVMHRDAVLYHLEMSIKREQLRLGTGANDDSVELIAVIAEDPSRLDDLTPLHREKLDAEDSDFLRSFRGEEAMLRAKLDSARAEVSRLRQLCTDKGVMRKNAPYHEEYIVFSDLPLVTTGNVGSATPPLPSSTLSMKESFECESGQTPPQRTSRDHARSLSLSNPHFPILLSNPRHVLEAPYPLTARGALRAATRLPADDAARPHLMAEAMKEYGISTLVVEAAAEDKSDFINRWLLHRLRTSPLEAELLYNVFSSRLKVRNKRRWQEDVLYFWSRDGANKSKEEYGGPQTTGQGLVIDDDDYAREGEGELEKEDLESEAGSYGSDLVES